MRVAVVLPTYNERENLPGMLEALCALPVDDLHVIVVDDNSPDGTGALADELCARQPRLHVLHRTEKQGLGPAYVAGFHAALQGGAQFVFEMDADHSHPVTAIPTMLEQAQQADLVLGSRYTQGGRIERWGLGRRAISRFGNWYARTILGVRVRDLTGGFKCFRRSTLERLDLGAVSSLGYNFQIELTYKVLRAGLRVVEVPITFTERQVGRSKFRFGIILESMRKVLLLRRSVGRPPQGS